MRTDPPRPIALIGLMGAGKSTVARALGERLGVSVADLDAMVVAETGRPIRELVDDQGETAFRLHEHRALVQALAAQVRVIACGGGIVTDPASRAVLAERCHVVWLDVSPAVAAERIRHETTSRPLARGPDLTARLTELERERETLYAGLARQRIATDTLSAGTVVERVLSALAGDG